MKQDQLKEEIREKLIEHFLYYTWCDGRWMAEEIVDRLMPLFNSHLEAREKEILKYLEDHQPMILAGGQGKPATTYYNQAIDDLKEFLAQTPSKDLGDKKDDK